MIRNRRKWLLTSSPKYKFWQHKLKTWNSKWMNWKMKINSWCQIRIRNSWSHNWKMNFLNLNKRTKCWYRNKASWPSLSTRMNSWCRWCSNRPILKRKSKCCNLKMTKKKEKFKCWRRRLRRWTSIIIRRTRTRCLWWPRTVKYRKTKSTIWTTKLKNWDNNWSKTMKNKNCKRLILMKSMRKFKSMKK